MQDFDGLATEAGNVDAAGKSVEAEFTVGAGEGLSAYKLSAGIEELELSLSVGDDATALDAELAGFSLQSVHTYSYAREGEFGQGGEGCDSCGAVGGGDNDVGAFESDFLHRLQGHTLNRG